MGWVSLCALVLFQFSAAAHQFQHDAGDIAQACRVCVQTERLDDIPAPAVVASVSLPPEPAAFDAVIGPLQAAPVRAAIARGPPVS